MKFQISAILSLGVLVVSTTLASSDLMEVDLKVKSHTPVYETVIEKQPYEYCWVEQIPVRQKSRSNPMGAVLGGLLGSQVGKGSGKDAAMVAGTIIGAGNRDKDEIVSGILGGLAGKQFGKGRGKDAAIVLGTLLGTQVSRKAHDTGVYRKEQRCETRYREVQKKVLSGYLHKVEFMGKSFERFYTQKKDTVRLALGLSFEADASPSSSVAVVEPAVQPASQAVRVVHRPKHRKHGARHHKKRAHWLTY